MPRYGLVELTEERCGTLKVGPHAHTGRVDLISAPAELLPRLFPDAFCSWGVGPT